MKKKYVFLTFAVTFVLCLLIFFLISFTGGKPVENEEAAIEIAKIHVLKKYHNNFDDYEIKIISSDDVWIVWYEPILKDEEWVVWWYRAIQGPVVYIDKSNGKVLYSDLSVTGEKSMEIAKVYVSKTYNNSFDDYVIKTKSELDVWIVWYEHVNKNNDVDRGPIVHIRKSNGEVIYCFYSVTDGKTVEDEEAAIEIAKEYAFRKYNKNFDDYELKSYVKGDVWHIYYSAGFMILGGGLPEVHIKKSNGEVIYCWLSE